MRLNIIYVDSDTSIFHMHILNTPHLAHGHYIKKHFVQVNSQGTVLHCVICGGIANFYFVETLLEIIPSLQQFDLESPRSRDRAVRSPIYTYCIPYITDITHRYHTAT